MLVLSRREGEEIVIGEGAGQIRLWVQRLGRQRVVLRLAAPREIPIRRGELPPLNPPPQQERDAA